MELLSKGTSYDQLKQYGPQALSRERGCDFKYYDNRMRAFEQSMLQNSVSSVRHSMLIKPPANYHVLVHDAEKPGVVDTVPNQLANAGLGVERIYPRSTLLPPPHAARQSVEYAVKLSLSNDGIRTTPNLNNSCII